MRRTSSQWSERDHNEDCIVPIERILPHGGKHDQNEEHQES